MSKVLPELTTELLATLWAEWKNDSDCIRSRWGFRDWLAPRVQNISDLAFCDACVEPVLVVDGHRDETAGGVSVCARCWELYWTEECTGCELKARYLDQVGDQLLCSYGCMDDYHWCEECSEYFYVDEGHDTDHRCECEVPGGLAFTIRNDGEPPLANDVRARIPLPIGAISEEAIKLIINLVYRETGSSLTAIKAVRSLEPVWQVSKGGNFTKRLSKVLYKDYGHKITSASLSRVGVIANEHTSSVNFIDIEITRDLNRPAGDFYHEDSCWWQSYGYSRCCLKSHGGFGLRSFEKTEVTGRAWVWPLKRAVLDVWVPTFDTTTPDAFVVFNGYGELSGYTPARIIGHTAGWTYKKIDFDVDPMYVNAGGYLVAPQDICDETTRISLSLTEHGTIYDEEHANV